MLASIQMIFHVRQEVVQVVPNQEDLGAQGGQGNLVQVVGDIVRDQAHRGAMQISLETRVGGLLARGYLQDLMVICLTLPIHTAAMVLLMIWFPRKGVAAQEVADAAIKVEVQEKVVVQEIVSSPV